jgi:hypothetical protein
MSTAAVFGLQNYKKLKEKWKYTKNKEYREIFWHLHPQDEEINI